MRKIKDIIQKPSQALRAMVDGLKEQSQRPDFKIDMSEFGAFYQGICYGCAATCAVQKLAGINLSGSTIETVDERSEDLNINYIDLEYFESAIDNARSGNASWLFDFFDIETDVTNIHQTGFHLSTANWQDRLKDVEAYILRLEKHGY